MQPCTATTPFPRHKLATAGEHSVYAPSSKRTRVLLVSGWLEADIIMSGGGVGWGISIHYQRVVSAALILSLKGGHSSEGTWPSHGQAGSSSAPEAWHVCGYLRGRRQWRVTSF